MRVFKAFLSSYELHVEKEKKAGRTRASAFEDKLVKRNKYMEMIEDLHISKETALTIDCEDLYEFDKSLYQQLVMYPQEIIPMMDVVVNNLYDEHKIPSQDPSQIDLVSEEYVPIQQTNHKQPTYPSTYTKSQRNRMESHA
jgi:DNA replicative helicase MCM subunit Mcm2 (Cdc46/Mcm family)